MDINEIDRALCLLEYNVKMLRELYVEMKREERENLKTGALILTLATLTVILMLFYSISANLKELTFFSCIILSFCIWGFYTNFRSSDSSNHYLMICAKRIRQAERQISYYKHIRSKIKSN